MELNIPAALNITGHAGTLFVASRYKFQALESLPDDPQSAWHSTFLEPDQENDKRLSERMASYQFKIRR